MDNYEGIVDELSQFELNHDIARIVEINGKKVLIDKRFVNIIKELNRKGYETLYCCSGHTIEENRLLIEWKCKTYPNKYNIQNAAKIHCSPIIYISFNEDNSPTVMPKFLYKLKSSRDSFEAYKKYKDPSITSYESYISSFGKKCTFYFDRLDLYDDINYGYHEDDLMNITYQIFDWVRHLPLIQYQ